MPNLGRTGTEDSTMRATDQPSGSDVAEAAPFHFADALIDRARSLGHCFCLGLDPHIAQIPSIFRRSTMDARAPETVAAIEDFLTAAIDLAAGRVVAVKPQSAMYERLGSPGIALLERVVAHAHDRGLLVLLDAKRGDIGSTAQAYAEAYLAPDSPNPADALTVNPYLGVDTLEPYITLARQYGRGVFVLVKTSNPGSGDFQDLRTGNTTVYGSVALALKPISDTLSGPGTGWSSLGVVVGATWPDEARAIRALLPKALFLLPGYGAQEGDPGKIAASLVPGPKGREGGLINSARATLFPPEGARAGTLRDWSAAFADTLARHAGAVADALRR
jgi:orotidine-5'-phosphate decarboxylase